MAASVPGPFDGRLGRWAELGRARPVLVLPTSVSVTRAGINTPGPSSVVWDLVTGRNWPRWDSAARSGCMSATRGSPAWYEWCTSGALPVVDAGSPSGLRPGILASTKLTRVDGSPGRPALPASAPGAPPAGPNRLGRWRDGRAGSLVKRLPWPVASGLETDDCASALGASRLLSESSLLSCEMPSGLRWEERRSGPAQRRRKRECRGMASMTSGDASERSVPGPTFRSGRARDAVLNLRRRSFEHAKDVHLHGLEHGAKRAEVRVAHGGAPGLIVKQAVANLREGTIGGQ